MAFDFRRARTLLQDFNLKALFVEELGWEPARQTLNLQVGDTAYPLAAVAQKYGFTVWLCVLPAGSLPGHPQRMKIDRKLSETSFEHLLVFADQEHSQQSWTWARREHGKPVALRSHDYRLGQSGDALLQKLQALYISLEEEEAGELSTVGVAGRAKEAFDVERVTKQFYKEFDEHRKAFLKLIEGIDDIADREWYASVMLNRLMFVYFIQRKSFLDGDSDYLRNRLEICQRENGPDMFYAFYRRFLLRLFHEGLGRRKRDRAAGLDKLLGNIPYLNGGLFDTHDLERPDRYGEAIQIPDKAFERIFDYFDRYQWHLDERALRADNEINPDVLGYIFEKYINQKMMGAFYTREDVTEYIGRNCIIPALLDKVRGLCGVSFDNPSGPAVWDMLQENPDRYIPPGLSKGSGEALPRTVDLDAAAGEPWGLPSETWRENRYRVAKLERVRQRLASGNVRSCEEMISLNLDLRQFTQDIVSGCEGPDLLEATWISLSRLSVLDPTGGSGAFLFAALNILEPLYEACLDRMEEFLAEWGPDGTRSHPGYHKRFTEVLGKVQAHLNRRYFVLKSVILNNLYAADLMEEASEICKLRLFLKLAAQVEPDPTKDNLGIEPLPDVDFNIRSGNSLVGYATFEEVRRAVTEGLDFDDAMGQLTAKAEALQQSFDAFRRAQTEGDGMVPHAEKLALQKHLAELEKELNLRMAAEQGIKKKDTAGYQAWLKSHQPFHWFIEFYGIMAGGGFDVVIGNPPYVVSTPAKVPYAIDARLFATFPTKNLYAMVFERSLQLAKSNASVGMIVQLTALSAEKMFHLQDLLLERGAVWASAFPRRPQSIFDGVEMPVSILLSRRTDKRMLFTTRVNRFYAEERPFVMDSLGYVFHDVRLHGHRLAKIGDPLDVSIYLKIASRPLSLDAMTTKGSKHVLYYQEACRYWVKACVGMPYFRRNGESMDPPHGRTLYFRDKESCAFASCLLNSTLFYWFYSAFSDCEHINDALLRDFKAPALGDGQEWLQLADRLAQSQQAAARRKTILTKQGHRIEYDEMDAPKSKAVIDEIDLSLARLYGFTVEETERIVNYDIKYRLGRQAETEADDLAE
jgi:hypothetical protein